MSPSSDQNHDQVQEDDLYKIGTVAKLTGIAVERLRAWERRYGLTPASREGKTRYFSGRQVERLTRIKRLIDQGHPVSTLINLNDDALSERLQLNIDQHNAQQAKQVGKPSALDSHHTRVGLVGTQLLMLEQTLSQAPRIDVVSRWVNLPRALAELAQQFPEAAAESGVEVVVVLLGSLTPESLNDLDDLPENVLPVVIYHYATESALAAASEQEVQLLRWPARWEDIELAVAKQAKSPLQAGRVTARRFSDEQLLSIACASADPSTDRGTNSEQAVGFGCACPADLVNLISALNAFSDHSQACSASAMTAQETNKSPHKAHAVPGRARAKPTDARQKHLRHAQIAQRTSEARLELELVLEDWVLAEGLLPVPN